MVTYRRSRSCIAMRVNDCPLRTPATTGRRSESRVRTPRRSSGGSPRTRYFALLSWTPMRVLVINLTVDADDTVFGFTTAWITALAERVEHVTVITMQAGRIALPDNVQVHTLGKERGYPEWKRLLRFWRFAWGATRGRRIDACFVHQGAIFA